jgi:predicted acyltransferase
MPVLYFFLFIVGVATPFSLGKRGQSDSKAWLFLHILARGLALFVLGELCYSIPSLNLDPAPAEFTPLRILRVAAVVFLGAGFVLLLYPWKSKRRSLIVPPVVALADVVDRAPVDAVLTG